MSKRNPAEIFQKIDPWIREDEDISTAGPQARHLYMEGLLYIARNLREGTIPKYVLGEIGEGIPSLAKNAKALVTVGLWLDMGDCWGVRNWSAIKPSGKQWNMPKEDREERSEKRKEAGRIGGHASKHSKQHPNPKCKRCQEAGWVS